MSDPVTIAIITAVAGLATIVINKRVAQVHKKVDEIELRIDGRMDELLKLTRESSEAIGNKKGREDQTEENKDKNRSGI